MATLSSAFPAHSQLCKSPRVSCCAAVGRCRFGSKTRRMPIVRSMATSIPADDRVPDMGKRQLMNLLLLGAISLPTGGMLLPYTYFFVPPGGGGGGGGIVAKDKLGNDVYADEWIKNHGPGDRTLTQGLKGDPTYLVVENDKTLATYAINAVCTHLGCVVPWNSAENKFICPCHGSQYNNQGRVVRGPAPLSLALVHADVDDGKTMNSAALLSGNFVPSLSGSLRCGGVKNLVDSSPELKKLPPQYVLDLPLNPLSVAIADIPAIDLRRLDGPPACRASAVADIGAACADWGFFRIGNHEIEMEEMMKVVEGFFDLSVEEKMKYWSEDVMSPVRYGTSLNTPKKHGGLHWRDYLRHYGHPFHNSFHLWPPNPPPYRKVIKKYLKEVRTLAMKILSAISESLGLDGDYIQKSMGGNGIQIMAANYYPPCPESHKTLGLAGHSDHGALTILIDNGVDGLQVKRNHSWMLVPHVPRTFVVNVGDYIEILSNGKYRSVEHRATVNYERPRVSVAAGHGPELCTVIGPADPLVDMADGLKFKPINYRDYVKFQQTTPARGKSALEIIRSSQ